MIIEASIIKYKRYQQRTKTSFRPPGQAGELGVNMSLAAAADSAAKNGDKRVIKCGGQVWQCVIKCGGQVSRKRKGESEKEWREDASSKKMRGGGYFDRP